MVATRRKTRAAPAPAPAPAPVPEELSPEEESESEEEQEQEQVEEMQESEEQESSEEDSEVEEQDEEEEEEGSDEEEEDNEEEKRYTANKLQITPVASSTGEQCTFDLRNLLAMNSHQVSTAALYSGKTKKGASDENLTIAPTGLGVSINEDYIMEKATDGCAQLLGALWQMPIERSDAGPMVFLPSWDEIKIPRALPPPPPKQETKWEKFAKEKGIPLNKEKRSQKVFDEESGEWKFRHGYNRANDVKEWPIMEVNPNDDPNADPWEKDREAKRTRVNKNTESRMRNEERAGNMSKGTTTRSLKSKEQIRNEGKAGGGAKILPSGVPVDLRSARGGDEKLSAAQRGKASITGALAATQRSTASLGKFDKIREGEPEKKKAVTSVKKRKLETSTDRRVMATEGERGMKVLKSVIDGGGVAKEKMRKKGQLAKGETAYDYDFDDGLGASSFRKKKGRAGAGKMKKMTKKRVK